MGGWWRTRDYTYLEDNAESHLKHACLSLHNLPSQRHLHHRRPYAYLRPCPSSCPMPDLTSLVDDVLVQTTVSK
jgi:hypothetical protein